MATDKDKDKAITAGTEPAPKAAETVYEVFGFKPKKDSDLYADGSIPVKIDGDEVDLAKASQEQLKKLYEAGKRFVRIAPAK